jgi:hypothetical protein
MVLTCQVPDPQTLTFVDLAITVGGRTRPGLDTGRACLYLAWRATTRKTVLANVQRPVLKTLCVSKPALLGLMC